MTTVTVDEKLEKWVRQRAQLNSAIRDWIAEANAATSRPPAVGGTHSPDRAVARASSWYGLAGVTTELALILYEVRSASAFECRVHCQAKLRR